MEQNMAETKTGPSEAMPALYELALEEVLEASRELAEFSCQAEARQAR